MRHVVILKAGDDLAVDYQTLYENKFTGLLVSFILLRMTGAPKKTFYQ